MQYVCQACSWQRSRHTIGADWNINKQRKPVQKMFHRRAAGASKRENNGQGAQVKQPRIFADHVTDAARSHKLHWNSLLNSPESVIRRSLLSSRSTENKKQKCVGQVGHDITAFPGSCSSCPEEVLLSQDFTAPEVRLQRSVYPPFWPYQIRLGASGRQTAERQIKLNFPRKTASAECVFLLP